jgi:hypothetical protein
MLARETAPGGLDRRRARVVGDPEDLVRVS